jgi:hypothetical protein
MNGGGRVRAFLYALGCVILITGAMGLALLWRLAPAPWIFGSVGSGAALLLVGGWVGLRAAAGEDWPRPRTRHVLTIAGLMGVLLSLQDWRPALWSAMVGLIGLYFSLQRTPGSTDRGPAQPSREDG